MLPVAGLAVTPAATAHAAALGAAIELAGYLAVLPTLTVSQHAVTHQISTQYLRPRAPGSGSSWSAAWRSGPGRSRS